MVWAWDSLAKTGLPGADFLNSASNFRGTGATSKSDPTLTLGSSEKLRDGSDHSIIQLSIESIYIQIAPNDVQLATPNTVKHWQTLSNTHILANRGKTGINPHFLRVQTSHGGVCHPTSLRIIEQPLLGPRDYD